MSTNEPDIRELLVEIRNQNKIMKRYLFLFGASLAVLLILQIPAIQTIINYFLIVVLILAVLLTSPWWSRLITFVVSQFQRKK